jgi:hypothetical protein
LDLPNKKSQLVIKDKLNSKEKDRLKTLAEKSYDEDGHSH